MRVIHRVIHRASAIQLAIQLGNEAPSLGPRVGARGQRVLDAAAATGTTVRERCRARGAMGALFPHWLTRG